MEAAFSSENLMSACKTTRLYNPEVDSLTTNSVDNPKNYITLPLTSASRVQVLQAVTLPLTATRSAHFLSFVISSLYSASSKVSVASASLKVSTRVDISVSEGRQFAVAPLTRNDVFLHMSAITRIRRK